MRLTRGTLTEPGTEQPVSRPRGRGEPRSVPPHARRRIPERRAGAARQDRHGLRQHQSARPGALPHPARRRIRAPATNGASIRATISPTASRTRSRASPIRSARWNSRITGRSTTGCLDNLPVPSRPHQYEFARLNLTYTVLSKRVLTELVRGGHVGGWDDPRMPTLAGLRRRGVPPAAMREFVKRIGVAKANSVVDVGMLEFSIREHLNKTALRRMAVLRPLKVVIENYPEGQSEELEAVNHPDDPKRRHAAHRVRPRALHRARRFHGESAEEILPAVAGQRSAAALRLFHHLPRGGEERRRRGRRAALHLRSRHQGRQRARRPQGEGDHALGVGGGFGAGRSAALQSAVLQARSGRRAISPPISIRSRSKCWPMPASSRRLPRGNSARRCSSSGRAISAATRIRRPAGWCSTAPSGLRDTWAKVSAGG